MQCIDIGAVGDAGTDPYDRRLRQAGIMFLPGRLLVALCRSPDTPETIADPPVSPKQLKRACHCTQRPSAPLFCMTPATNSSARDTKRLSSAEVLDRL